MPAMRRIKIFTISTMLLAVGSICMPTHGRGQELEECGAWEVGDVCVDSCGCSYCNPSPLWMRAEYVHAWVNNESLPALITSSPSGTDWEDAGVLGGAGKSVLFGDEAVGGGSKGVRGTFGLRLGHYFDCLSNWEIESTLIWLGSSSHPDEYSSVSVGDPILARPFFDPSNGDQNSGSVAYPGEAVGSITADVTSEVNSACLLLRRTLHWDERLRLDLLAGYRYFNYSERLAIDQTTVVVDVQQPVDEQTVIDVADRFRSDNRFDGCEVGLLAQYHHNAWEFEAFGKLALGKLRQQRTVDGLTAVGTIAGDPALFEGGFLASPARIGLSSVNEFAVLPELNLSMRRHITPDFIFTCGYTLIYLNDVIRLGGQIDARIDSRDLQPEVPLARDSGTDAVDLSPEMHRTSDLWVQGIHVGLEW